MSSFQVKLIVPIPKSPFLILSHLRLSFPITGPPRPVDSPRGPPLTNQLVVVSPSPNPNLCKCDISPPPLSTTRTLGPLAPPPPQVKSFNPLIESCEDFKAWRCLFASSLNLWVDSSNFLVKSLDPRVESCLVFVFLIWKFNFVGEKLNQRVWKLKKCTNWKLNPRLESCVNLHDFLVESWLFCLNFSIFN